MNKFRKLYLKHYNVFSESDVSSLRRFLLRKGLWVKFLRNCNRLNPTGFQSIFSLRNRADMIKRGFLWSISDEGYDFWYAVNREWEARCK